MWTAAPAGQHMYCLSLATSLMSLLSFVALQSVFQQAAAWGRIGNQLIALLSIDNAQISSAKAISVLLGSWCC